MGLSENVEEIFQIFFSPRKPARVDDFAALSRRALDAVECGAHHRPLQNALFSRAKRDVVRGKFRAETLALALRALV
jgi:hypothetical protein